MFAFLVAAHSTVIAMPIRWRSISECAVAETHGMANRPCLSIKRFDLAFQLDQQRMAFAIHRLACGDLDPAFADAVLLDIHKLFAIESNANVMFKHGRDVMGAARVNGEVVGQRG
jgi:hypothetical protein